MHQLAEMPVLEPGFTYLLPLVRGESEAMDVVADPKSVSLVTDANRAEVLVTWQQAASSPPRPIIGVDGAVLKSKSGPAPPS